MSATAIDLHAWVEEQKGTVPADIHPAGQCVCHAMISEMHQAAEAGDNGRLVYLLQELREKIAEEVAWEEDKLRGVMVHA
jgi:hypothetical protein